MKDEDVFQGTGTCQNCGAEFIDADTDELIYDRTSASGDHYLCPICGGDIQLIQAGGGE